MISFFARFIGLVLLLALLGRAQPLPGAATNLTVENSGRVVTHANVASRFVPARRVDVWLPPGYAATASGRYPVIYMHDGQNLFDPATTFGGVPWSVDLAMLRLIAAGRTSGAIIVGIWNAGMERDLEYMPQKDLPGAFVQFSHGTPDQPITRLRSDAYLKFLVEELKPFIDRTYRTKPDAPNTFVMGSSMGGLISAYALAEYPQVFGGAGCVSTHLPAGDGALIGYLA